MLLAALRLRAGRPVGVDELAAMLWPEAQPADGELAGPAAGLREAQRIFERIGAADAAGLAAELDALTRAG